MSTKSKVLGLLLAVLLLAGIFGCAKPAPAPAPAPTPAPAPAPKPAPAPAPAPKPAPAPAPAPKPWPKAISIAVSTATGGAMVSGLPLAELLTKNLGIPTTTEVMSGASYSAFAKGMIEMNIGVLPSTYWSVMEPDVLKETKGVSQPIRHIMNICHSLLGTTVHADSKIMSYADLDGKTVAIFSKTSQTVDLGGKWVFEETGVLDKIKGLAQVGSKFGKEGMIQRTLDAWWYPIGGTPGGQYAYQLEVDKAVGLRLLDPGKDAILAVTKKHPAFGAWELPAGWYNELQTKPVWALDMGMAMNVSRDLDEELVYQITKLLWENIESLSESGRYYKSSKLPQSIENAVIPIHAGAIKYYKEAGVWSKEMEAHNEAMLAKLGEKK